MAFRQHAELSHKERFEIASSGGEFNKEDGELVYLVDKSFIEHLPDDTPKGPVDNNRFAEFVDNQIKVSLIFKYLLFL